MRCPIRSRAVRIADRSIFGIGKVDHIVAYPLGWMNIGGGFGKVAENGNERRIPMKQVVLIAVLAISVLAAPGVAQKTPTPAVAAYDALADAILGLRAAESDFVMSILDHHFQAAARAYKNENWDKAAAQMALFANEGDNAVAGIRKRLVEGGHHHNAAGEEAGTYDEGFVIVTKKAKRRGLAASKALREAQDAGAREAAWADFEKLGNQLIYDQLMKK